MGCHWVGKYLTMLLLLNASQTGTQITWATPILRDRHLRTLRRPILTERLGVVIPAWIGKPVVAIRSLSIRDV